MVRAKLLIIEDDRTIAALYQRTLADDGYQIIICYDGNEGLRLARAERPDLILMDRQLPGIGGADLCRILRRSVDTASIPIIMVTVLSSVEDCVHGLDAGADDYLIKPFNIKELQARIRTHLRRYQRELLSIQERRETWPATIILDAVSLRATILAQTFQLSLREFEILGYLVRNIGQPISTERLFRDVWRSAPIGDTGTIRWHMHKLRHKLNKIQSNPPLLQNIHGQGYILHAPKEKEG